MTTETSSETPQGTTLLTGAPTPPAEPAASGTEGSPPPTEPAPAPAGEKPAGEPDAAPGAEKPKEGEKPAEKQEAAPADLQLSIPEAAKGLEGYLEPLVAELKPLAKELGLDAPKAQKLVDMLAQCQVAQVDAVLAEMNGWSEAIRADAEMGGANFEATKAAATKAIVKFGSPELRSWLEKTGTGNHPELVRVMARIGKAISEDSISGTAGTRPVSPQDQERQFHEALYPTMFNQQA